MHQIKIATEQNLLLLYDRGGVGLKAFPWRIHD
jgi:hypothetical protein